MKADDERNETKRHEFKKCDRECFHIPSDKTNGFIIGFHMKIYYQITSHYAICNISLTLSVKLSIKRMASTEPDNRWSNVDDRVLVQRINHPSD